MFELIPSETMRQKLKEEGFEFDDFQKATLIWNAPNRTRAERLEALRELENTTEDAGIKSQIRERMEYEKRIEEKFFDNSGSRYIYIVKDADCDACGYFADFEGAYRYLVQSAEKYRTQYCIDKHLVIRTEEDMTVHNPVAGVYLNERNEITRLWSFELPEEDKERVDGEERFESHFIKIPFDLGVGCSVRDVENNTYGILSQGKEEWESYLKRIEERNLSVDYYDVQVVVYVLDEKGYWSHQHINPLHLEMDFPKYTEGDELGQCLCRATEALSEYLSHKSKGIEFRPELVVRTAKEYAELCHKKSQWGRLVREAEKPEDLLL